MISKENPIIFRIEALKDSCNKILYALDTSVLDYSAEVLNIKTNEAKNGMLFNVHGENYSVKLNIPIDSNMDDFTVSVNATLFLKLITKITTDTVQMYTDDKVLYIKGNGNYKIPLVFEGDKMFEFKEVELNNITLDTNVDSKILKSIYDYNTKQLDLGTAVNALQTMYYVDNKGCLTATGGACVNNFELDKEFKLLLNKKLVRLFRLFDTDSVHFCIAKDSAGEVEQTKVLFETDNIRIVSIISCDDTLLNKFPADKVRELANSAFDYSIDVKKEYLLEAINRLLLFDIVNKTLKTYGKFIFNDSSVQIFDSKEENCEVVYYNDKSDALATPYEARIDLSEFKVLLEMSSESDVHIKFGDHRAFVISRANIENILQECK